MTRATLIYNPVAGRNPARRQAEICAAAYVLRQSGFTLDVRTTTGPGSARHLAWSAGREGADALIVCGGDGTINDAVNGLAPGACPLAILPGGTANIAAKDLGLPHNPVAAARELKGARPRRIALGRVTWRPTENHPPTSTATSRFLSEEPNGALPPSQDFRYFLSVAGVGFDAYIIQRLGWDLKREFGVAAYVWEALRQVWRYGFPRFVCRRGPNEWRGAMAVFQRTERYAGWLHLAPGASLLNHGMRLVLFESCRPRRYFFYAAAVGLRRHLQLHDLRMVESWPLVCSAEDSSRHIYVQLDGELAGELPATFDLVPDALTLLLPERLAPAAIPALARLSGKAETWTISPTPSPESP
ncbi:MAG TPA: diacylglycerol kinase family protein [Terriglobia bacterium]